MSNDAIAQSDGIVSYQKKQGNTNHLACKGYLVSDRKVHQLVKYGSTEFILSLSKGSP